MKFHNEDVVTVRDIIHMFNPTEVLNGSITFEVFDHDKSGRKWFFHNEDLNLSAVENFCIKPGISDCMNLVVLNNGTAVECFPDFINGKMTLRVEIDAVDLNEIS